jgi:hypothetical protein
VRWQPGMWFNDPVFNSGDRTERMVIACLRGDDSALASLVALEGKSLLLNATDREGVSVLHNISHSHASLYTPLLATENQWPVAKVHVESAQMLSIQPGHPHNFFPCRQYRGMSALMAASFAGHLSLVKYLVEIGGTELLHATSSVRTLNLPCSFSERRLAGHSRINELVFFQLLVR